MDCTLGADQLRGHREADLRLCFRICKSRFSYDAAHIWISTSFYARLITISNSKICNSNMSHIMGNSTLCHIQATKAQISLHIPAVRSAPFLLTSKADSVTNLYAKPLQVRSAKCYDYAYWIMWNWSHMTCLHGKC